MGLGERMLNYSKKIGPVEPFVGFGKESIIWTKEDAARIAVANSYYFFVAGCGLLVLFPLILYYKYPISSAYLIFMTVFFFAMATAIRILKSRIASVMILIVAVVTVVTNFLEQRGLGPTSLINFVLLAAAMRSVKATFFFHRKQTGQSGS